MSNNRITDFFSFPERYHGTGGYLTVSDVPYRTRLGYAYLEAGVEMGYEIVDFNAERQTGNISGLLMTWSLFSLLGSLPALNSVQAVLMIFFFFFLVELLGQYLNFAHYHYHHTILLLTSLLRYICNTSKLW